MKNLRTSTAAITLLAGLALSASTASAQSLFQRSAEIPTTPDGKPDHQAALRETSLTYSEAPPPRQIQINDLVTIIIDETSKQQSDQSLDTKKDYDWQAALNKFPSLKKLIDGELGTGDSTPVVELDVESKNKFKGEGTFERTDKFSARIQAKVIDVKPNGVLVVEARKAVQTGEEKQTIILSGNCRREDVTLNNTVLSTQLAELSIVSEQEGQVKDSATKGWIPRVLETLFNF
jgi:flagellar L-ring protein precursor FlgH